MLARFGRASKQEQSPDRALENPIELKPTHTFFASRRREGERERGPGFSDGREVSPGTEASVWADS